jgi:hypothetical protein
VLASSFSFSILLRKGNFMAVISSCRPRNNNLLFCHVASLFLFSSSSPLSLQAHEGERGNLFGERE